MSQNTPARARRLALLQRQHGRLDKRLHRLRQLDDRYSRLRLLTFLTGFAAGIAVYYLISGWMGWSLWALTFAVFNIEAHVHRKIRESIRRHAIWLDWKQSQVARMTLDWEHVPYASEHPPDPDHPFELDLDITGKRSLHHLLNTAISRGGGERLRHWLLRPEGDLARLTTRQTIVRELAPLARFRDKLYLAYHLVSREPLDDDTLLSFLRRSHAVRPLKAVTLLSSVLAAINILLFGLAQFAGWPAYWYLTLAVYAMVYFLNQRHVEPMMHESVFITEELRKLRSVLRYLETYPYRHHENLKRLCACFWERRRRPSRQLRLLTWLSLAIGLRMNPLFRLALNLALPWDFACALSLNRLKPVLGEHVSEWLASLIELEALSSLANFAYLNPEASFPAFVEDEHESPLRAIQLGHPLIKHDLRRCNDFAFGEVGELALITGSNMSGKSTFLKTLGINVCLALAGAPVIAERMQMRIFRLFTCIKVNDSIADGFSFFYAEVRRLRALLSELERAERLPLLFLIDEIFKGTNNRERLIGSRAYIRALAGRNGVGAITTHDLELTTLPEEIPEVVNYHFREEVRDGRMVFDYKLRPGPCPSTNALKIMHLAGLPTDA